GKCRSANGRVEAAGCTVSHVKKHGGCVGDAGGALPKGPLAGGGILVAGCVAFEGISADGRVTVGWIAAAKQRVPTDAGVKGWVKRLCRRLIIKCLVDDRRNVGQTRGAITRLVTHCGVLKRLA